MKVTLLLFSVLFSFTALSQDLKKSKPNEWRDDEVNNKFLIELYSEINKLDFNVDKNHASALAPLNRYVDAYIFGSIGEIKLIDEIMVLYFLKAYEADRNGNPNLMNVKCCTQSSPLLSLFIYNFYKSSESNPVHGLPIVHIYKWIVQSQSSFESIEIKELLDRLH